MWFIQRYVPKNRITYLGLRSVDSAEEEFVDSVDAHTMQSIDQDTVGIFDSVVDKIGKSPVHVSFDIDVLDPSLAPGTGTPVNGGMNERQLSLLIDRLRMLNIVSLDMVEVNPLLDNLKFETTSKMAAKIINLIFSCSPGDSCLLTRPSSMKSSMNTMDERSSSMNTIDERCNSRFCKYV